jgi:hypothetical protein
MIYGPERKNARGFFLKLFSSECLRFIAKKNALLYYSRAFFLNYISYRGVIAADLTLS